MQHQLMPYSLTLFGALLVVVAAVREKHRPGGLNAPWLTVLLGSMLLPSLALIPLSFDVHWAYGVVHAFIAVTALGLFTYGPFRPKADIFKIDAVDKAGLLSFVGSIAAGVVIVPIAVLPALSNLQQTDEAAITYDEQALQTGAARLAGLVSAMEQAVKDETGQITAALSRLQLAARQRQQDVARLADRQKQLAEEADHYRHLASLSQEQAAAILRSLNRGKWLDYALGFVIGVTSSLTATIAVWLFQRRRTAASSGPAA